MSTIHLKDEVYEELIQEGTVLVDFYADWCGPCKMLGPVLESLAQERTDVKVVKVNVDEQERVAVKEGIMSIPVLKLFKNGSLIDTKIGFMTKDAINDWIDGK